MHSPTAPKCLGLSMLPGTTVTVRLPVSAPFVERPSLLVRLTANFAFIPSDYNPEQCTDTRLLSLQLIPEQLADASDALGGLDHHHAAFAG